jgi:hypothetical protein
MERRYPLLARSWPCVVVCAAAFRAKTDRCHIRRLGYTANTTSSDAITACPSGALPLDAAPVLRVSMMQPLSLLP